MKTKLFLLKTVALLFLGMFSNSLFAQKTYKLITSTADLTAGAKYIISDTNTASTIASVLGYQNNNNRPEVYPITVTNNGGVFTSTITPATIANETTKPYEITLGGSTGAWSLFDAATNGYLRANSSSSNNLVTGITANWTITFNAGAAVMTCTTGSFSRNVLRYNPNNFLFSCYQPNNSQNAVYLYKEVPAVPCSGTPTPGNTIASVNPVTGGGSTVLSLQNATSGSGVTYQWQSAPTNTGPWTDITGATAAAYTASPTAKTWYRCKVTCSSNSGTSTPVEITLIPCASVPTSNDGLGITNVVVGSANFPVADETQYNYTASIPNLTQGATIPSAVTFATGYSYDTHIWIDFNDDGTFNNTNEKVFTGNSSATSPTTLDTSFLLSGTAALGQHRLRIGTADNGQSTPTPCYSGMYGVTIDMIVNIVAPLPCSGTPAPGNTIATPPSVVVGGSTVLSLQNATSGIGVTYQWQSGTSSTGPWTNIGGSTVTLSVSPTANTWYRCVVTCTGNTGTSNPVQVLVTPCIPIYTNGCGLNDRITNFVLNSISNNSGTTCSTSPPGYSDYTTMSTNLTQTLTYTGVISIGNGGDAGVAIWIDFNNNNIFETGENVFASPVMFTSGSINNPINVVVPAAANLGSHHMRVRLVYNRVGTNIDPCTSYNYGEAEDYSVNIVPLLPCTGTPTGGTSTATPNTGPPSSVFTASVTGSTFGLGLTYQWESAPSTTGPWTNVAGANTATANITAPAALGVTTYYRSLITCTNSGLFAYSSVTSFTTGYCSSTVTPGDENDNYILDVKFRGTLLDTSNTSTYSSSPSGYQDWTGLAVKSKQADGNGVNVYMGSLVSGYYKAWIDWDQNGIFSPSEVVYNANGVVQASTTFGFVIPVGKAPGFYRLRLRVNGTSGFFGGMGDPDADPCGVLNYPGETEDYLFEVVANCPSNILTAPRTSRCGAGSVALHPTATAGVSEFRWYYTEGDIVPFTTTASSGNTTTFDTPSISGTTTYWVTAYNGTCESLIKTPMVAAINATPTIAFTPSTVDVCQSDVTVALAATGSNQVEFLIQDDFEDGILAPFTNVRIQNVAGQAAVAEWQPQTSIFQPAQQTWKPAISSGINGNKFVLATSDVGTGTTENALVSPVVNSSDYTNLTLSFTMYYSRYYPDNTSANLDYVAVEVSTNGGTTYPNVLETIRTDIGIGTKFSLRTYNLSSYVGQANLRFRIRYHGEWCDGVAVDNIELFGEKPLTPSFAWTSNHPVQFYTDVAGTIPYTAGNPASSIFLKFTEAQLEAFDGWTVAATASLTNLCSAVGNISIGNNAKFWNQPGLTDWNTTNWKPNTGIPDATKCVIVKTPVNILANTDGFAKNIRVESTGKLTINADASLTVTDAFINQATSADVVIASDGNLKQITDNPLPANSGSVTAKRDIKLSGERKQYNYVISPLENQSLASVYKDALGNPVPVPFVLYHNESTNRFYNSSGAYIKGRGLAVKEPAATYTPSTMTARFTGTLTNGAFTFGLVNSNPSVTLYGYNLTGNPYPSNIDLRKLYDINGGKTDPNQVTSPNISETFYFWDNNGNTIFEQQGNGYLGQSYAIFNVLTGSNGTGTKANSGTKVPTKIVKVGQGFMTKSKISNYNLNFNNSIRTIETSAVDFLGKENSPIEDDRYWLKMTAPTGIVSTIAVVYYPGGNHLFGPEDSRTMGGSDEVYSIVENEKIAIDGRSSFAETDIIPLGTKHFGDGHYTIAIDNKEGVFATAQNIYLKDKQNGIITNLSQGSYTFTATAGENTGRFEIIYKPESVLVTDSAIQENLVIYREGQDFIIQSTAKKIDEVEVYDPSGRLMYTLRPHVAKVYLQSDYLTRGVYLLKIKQGDLVTTKKIIK